MKKINILVIATDHLATLYDDNSKRVSIIDILTFYGIPLGLAAGYCLKPFPIPVGTYSALIAVFSVFAALLFSAQIALYNLAPREAKQADDVLEEKRNRTIFLREKRYFSDINSNVSYLILLSCVSLIVFLVFLVFSISDNVAGPLLIAIVCHFFLTLLMVVKRSHIAFSLRS